MTVLCALCASACSQSSPTFPGEGGDGDSDTDGDSDSDTDADTDAYPTIETGEGSMPAADPKLDGFVTWPVEFAIDPAGLDQLSCSISLSRGGASIVSFDVAVEANLCSFEWDGADGDGGYLDPGLVDVVVEVFGSGGGNALASLETTLEVVRLGFSSINLVEHEVGARAPLLWAHMGGASASFYEFTAQRAPFGMGADATEDGAAADLDMADGTPRAYPQSWTDMQSLPLDGASSDGVEADTFNIPTAWVAGSDMAITVTASTAAAGFADGTTLQSVDVRLVAPLGMVVEGEGLIENGAQITALLEDTPVPAVGRYSLELEWGFQVKPVDGETWQNVPGSVITNHVFYGLVDEPTMGFTAIPHRAWAEIVDTIAVDWVAGATADPIEVGSLLVEHIYDDMGLEYDIQQGACTYTEYPSSWFSGCLFDIVAFQDRDLGDVINCSDAAAILSTYANMVGINYNYHILYNQGWYSDGFDLNYIQAIGGTVFDETPFASGGGSFSYHAVVGPSDGTIYDATLALDGDGTPTAPPHTFLYPQDMTEVDYLVALSSEWSIITVEYNEKVRLQSFSKSFAGGGSPFESVVPQGMELTSVRVPQTPGVSTTLAFSRKGAKRPSVLLKYLSTGGEQEAVDALMRWKRSLSKNVDQMSSVGEVAYGGRGMVGFVRGSYMVSVRSLESGFDIADMARRADRVAMR